MLILAIDPGTTQSAWVKYSTKQEAVVGMNIYSNESLLAIIRCLQPGHYDALVIEDIVAMGMPIGQTTLETMFWVGRFCEAFDNKHTQRGNAHRITRRDIKLHLCGTCQAKDKNVSQALIDRFGGTMKAAKGTKKQPGPLYGIKSHIWAALAVAVVWTEENAHEKGAKKGTI